MLACLVLFTPPAPAQAETAASLQDYMDAAVRTHPQVATAAARADSAAADRTDATAALLPTLNAHLGWTYNQYEAVALLPDPAGGAPIEIVIVPQQQRDAVLSLRVPLVDAPGLAAWRASRSAVEAAIEDQRAAEAELRMSVARAWYAAVAAQDLVAAADRALRAAEESRRTLAVRVEVGTATALTVQRAELEVLTAERLRIEGQRAWLTARRSLATLSGLPEPEALPAPPAELGAVPPEAELLAAAESGRPEIVAAKARVEQLRLARSAAWLGYAPTVAATASERVTNASGFSGESASWTVGVELDWLLLGSGSRSADARRALAALEVAEATLAEVSAAVRDEVHAAWLDVDAASARLLAARRAAEIAAATAEEVRVRFEVGTASQLEIIQADRDALQAEVDRIRAEGERAIAALALQRAAGLTVGG